MSVRFARLRIAGFKSFAEPASVEILPGLTGIVGPNGCGKSNVVEALRWAMGESSARSLRGGEMDDLIFAGTAARPARNLAEVTLTLEDAAGIAPPPFHDQPELQISRRIERGAGSNYRVNGREIRARDVQTLFADLASGARSSAMVSQGRVAAIVNARPEERRSILEEAAGITGLHARRHEAELKLRATEANLARAEDLRLQLEARLGELGTQSKQASRYREIAAGLREAEAGLLALLHARARLAVRQARESASATETALQNAIRQASEAADAEMLAQGAIEAPREAEAIARTGLERLRITGEILAREEARAAADAAEARSRLDQSQADAIQASARLDDARAALAQIEADRDAAQAREKSLPAEREQAESALRAAHERLADASAALSQATAQETAAQNRAAQIRRDHEAAQGQLARLDSQLEALRAEHAAAVNDLPPEERLAELQAAREAATAALDLARIETELAGEARIEAARDADAARAAAEEAARAHQAARRADQEAAHRAATLAAELAQVGQACTEAELGCVPDADRHAAQEHVQQCAEALAQARLALEAAESARSAAQQAHAAARQQLTEAARHRSEIEAARNTHAGALARAESQLEQLSRELAAARAAIVPEAALQRAQDELAAAEAALTTAQDALEQADRARAASEQAALEERQALAASVAGLARIEAEADGLARAIGDDSPDEGGPAWSSLAQTLAVPPGLEAALAALLAEGLDASLDPQAPSHWRNLPDLPGAALPGGAVAFSAQIAAPPPLGRILSHAGLIEEDSQGDALQGALAPGQCLVSRTGAVWRWDGYRLAAGSTGEGAASRGAMALQQRNRLREIRAQRDAAAAQTASLRERAQDLAQAHVACLADTGSARALRDAAEREAAQLRQSVSALGSKEAAARARLHAISPQHEQAVQLREDAVRALAEATAREAALAGADGLVQAVGQARSHEESCMLAEAEARKIRQAAETELESARKAEASLLARHGEAASRLAALAPQRDRLAANHAAATAEAEQAHAGFAAMEPPDRAQEAHTAAVAAAEAARSREEAARRGRQDAEQQRDRAQAAQAEAAAMLARQRSRIEALAPRLEALAAERAEAFDACEALSGELQRLPDPELAARHSAEAREAVAQARDHENHCRDARARCAAEASSLEATRASLQAALADWTRRTETAGEEHEAAIARLAADKAAYEALAEIPMQSDQRRRDHAQALAQAEQAYTQAKDDLDSREQALIQAQAARREADAALSEAREARLRLQGRAEQADAILAQLLADTPDPPRTVPDDLSEAAEASLRRRVTRLARERDDMGPVNLRADIESQEAQERADAIAREREELESAIARLRGSIGHLNREGRERLLAVFEKVDAHFQALFARMFNGGRAHLGMVGDDDPLQAGLEIYAQPPGKKLATLSLLSGGEQALTALSLIFAVFRCNPAPVCVLDEVDAPLDDANVARFCALLADMVSEAGTRFLVVTHHQLTMAHMDRLYGVTMQERGVSRLLSVDLTVASGMVEQQAERGSPLPVE